MKYINHYELLKDLLKSRPHFSLLDIGTGNGQKLLPLIDYFQRLAGIDLEPNSIRAGRKLLSEERKRLKLKIMDGAALRYPADKFDCVSSFFTLHHLRLLNRVLSEAYRVLQPEGIFFAVDQLDRECSAQQNNYLYLHKLKIEVDNKLGKNHFNLILPEDMVKILKDIGYKDTGFELFLEYPAADINPEELKEKAIAMVNQVQNTIEQSTLGGFKKEAFGKRLKEIEHQILKSGVERTPSYAVFGFKPG
jgi:SAM-dependent methyltransferase